MKITVEVTQEDIDEGCRHDLKGKTGGCMVHRAFMRATEGAFPFFGVYYHGIVVFPSRDALLAEWSPLFEIGYGDYHELLGQRISAFDGLYDIAPFEFTVEIPDEVLLIAPEEER